MGVADRLVDQSDGARFAIVALEGKGQLNRLHSIIKNDYLLPGNPHSD